MSQITVLGGHGYIGSHLVSRLQKLGHQVWVPFRDDFSIFHKDLGHVLYAIGLTADFRSRPFDTVDAHVSFLNRVLKESKHRSFLYLSSTRVYSHCLSADEKTPIITYPDDPSDLYNLSKLLGESLTLNCGLKNTRVARLSNVVGGQEPSDSFLSRLITEARTGEIFLQTSLKSKKDYIFIDDAVEMIIEIMLRGSQRIYNIASGVQIEHREWIQKLQKIHACKVTVAGSAPTIVMPEISIDRFINEFHFKPASAMRWLVN